MILIPLDSGTFVVVHPCSTFLPEGDRINRSRQILTRKRALWVSYSTPDLALIGKRGSVQEPPKSQNLPRIVVFGHRKPTQ